ncbi:hypothetical protein LCM28_09850 [Salipiger pacificus]|nr:hypothetical protein [Alloyangia pacifica]
MTTDFKAIIDRAAQHARTSSGGWTPAQARTAVHAKLVSIHGADAVGPLSDYESKPLGYWQIKENVLASARTFTNSTKWQKACAAAAKSAFDNGWFEEATAHMRLNRRRSGYWQVKENVLASARKFETITAWRKGEPSAYAGACSNGWLEEATAHMTQLRQPKGHWKIKENVLASAAGYTSRKDWREAEASAYYAAKSAGWMEEATAHMTAGRAPNGLWNDKAKVLAKAREFDTRMMFRRQARSAHKAAVRYGWLEEACAHMIEIQKPIGYWQIKENVIASAKEFTTRTAWRKAAPAAAESAMVNGWFEEATAHMVELCRPKGYWDIKENVLASARKFETITAWQKGDPSAIMPARRNGWFEEATAHMTRVLREAGYWNVKEHTIESAREFTSISAWIAKYRTAYEAAKANGWLEEATSHMIQRTPRGHWKIKENVLASARACTTRNEWWSKYGAAYKSAKENGWFEEAVAHMSKADA